MYGFRSWIYGNEPTNPKESQSKCNKLSSGSKCIIHSEYGNEASTTVARCPSTC